MLGRDFCRYAPQEVIRQALDYAFGAALLHSRRARSIYDLRKGAAISRRLMKISGRVLCQVNAAATASKVLGKQMKAIQNLLISTHEIL
jgi:hypothetical protein